MVDSTGTSFIPKKNIASDQKEGGKSLSLILLFTIVIFAITVISAGGVFSYGRYLSGKIENSKNSLALEKENFEFTTIENFTRLDKRIKASKELLDKHIDLTGLFETLESETLKNIQFESMDFSIKKDTIKIFMKGVARSYSSVALQSDIFGDNPMIKNPIFSNLDINNLGDVVFDFTANIDKELILYKSRLE
jgi:hypothetical protein